MYVGQILAEIWSGMISDCHPVLAGYINEEAEEEILNKPLEWIIIIIIKNFIYRWFNIQYLFVKKLFLI